MLHNALYITETASLLSFLSLHSELIEMIKVGRRSVCQIYSFFFLLQLEIKSWLVTGDSLSMELLKTEKGNTTVALSRLRELQNTSALPHRTVKSTHVYTTKILLSIIEPFLFIRLPRILLHWYIYKAAGNTCLSRFLVWPDPWKTPGVMFIHLWLTASLYHCIIYPFLPLHWQNKVTPLSTFHKFCDTAVWVLSRVKCSTFQNS